MMRALRPCIATLPTLSFAWKTGDATHKPAALTHGDPTHSSALAAGACALGFGHQIATGVTIGYHSW